MQSHYPNIQEGAKNVEHLKTGLPVYSEFQASLGYQIPSENNNNTNTKQKDVWFWGPYSFCPKLLFC